MKRRVLVQVLVLGVMAMQTAIAQNAAQPLVIGETFVINSKHLAEPRHINVYAPTAYLDSANMPLPVLYMPDGGLKEDFLHIAGLLQVSVGNGTMRPFLLVGIENTERRRDMTGPTNVAEDKKIAPRVGGSSWFRAFIREELMPEIKKRYATTAETVIMGESLAGLFVVETFLVEPQLFDTYIAFDPSLWWNNSQLVKEAQDRLRRNNPGNRTIYLASSDEPELSRLTLQFAESFKQVEGKGYTLHYQPMPNEKHSTIYHPAALLAFRTLFEPPKPAK
ncbi:MAG TPA: alpha/beta hydrolase-fold protein [Longimicrobiales bacterium]